MQLIFRNSIDLLYVNGPRLLPTAAIAARVRSTPLVFHCHNRMVQRSGVFAIGQSLRLSRAGVIACCGYAAEPMRPYVKPEHFSVVYSGVSRKSLRRFSPESKLRHIGVIGRVEPEKGQMEFISAARSVLEEYPDCRFSIIGAPMFSSANYLEDVVRASSQMPVDFLGWQDDISGVLSRLDLLVVPSRPVDSAPRVILEGFAAGVPVLAFPSGGIPEIIKDAETGFLAAGMTPEALAQRIRSILKMDYSPLQAIIERARERWRQQYTLDAYQRRVGEVLMLTAKSRMSNSRRS